MRRGELRRALVVSAAAHAVLLLALIIVPETRPLSLPGVIAVDLVAAPSRRAAPLPAAKPVPRTPVPKKVVLPAEPTLPRPRPREVKPEPHPEPVEEAYEDVLAGLRAEMGEKAPEPALEPATQEAAAEPGAGGLVTVSPEVAAWVRRAKIHVRSVWVVPPGFRTQPLQTSVLIDLDAEGRVLGKPRIIQRSGNYHYDDGVVRAIRKASPLPAPPEAGTWRFVFLPEDSY
jgi:TonB family protein